MSQAATVQVPRSVDTIVSDVWSPAELHALDGSCDALYPSLPPLSVPSSTAHAVRFSMALAPFETLHAKWKPQSTDAAGAVGESSRGSGDGHTLSDAVFKVEKMTWETRDVLGSEGYIADQCKKTFWFRITTTIATRSYVVERSQSQLLVLISALRYSFPSSYVPVDEQASLELASLMCDFFAKKGPMIASFLPALFFLFETRERVAVPFFNALEGEIKNRQGREATLNEAVRPKQSKGWFSWGGGSSSKNKTKDTFADPAGLMDTIAFLDANASTIPACVKPAFLIAFSRQQQFQTMAEKAKELCTSLQDDALRLESVATGLAVSPQTNEPLPVWYAGKDGQDLAEARGLSADVKRTAALVQQLVFGASAIQSSIGATVLCVLAEVAEKSAIVAKSRLQYLEAYLQMKKTFTEIDPFLSGKASLVKGSPAASSPGLLRQVADQHKWQGDTLATWEKVIEEECNHVGAILRELQRKICTYLFTSISTRLESYDEKHHSHLAQVFGPKDADHHVGILELLEPTEPRRPDDIIHE